MEKRKLIASLNPEQVDANVFFKAINEGIEAKRLRQGKRLVIGLICALVSVLLLFNYVVIPFFIY